MKDMSADWGAHAPRVLIAAPSPQSLRHSSREKKCAMTWGSSPTRGARAISGIRYTLSARNRSRSGITRALGSPKHTRSGINSRLECLDYTR